ncbi:hypothetical protein LJK87_19230 [Paenibacillus sp. P25]|nr:hypothetical protein LJK87_19230 [Paenibacillus sp. P25]
MSTAYLLLLHQLSAVERAVFLLREVFEYEYDEIAAIVGKSGSNCRQIFHRAKRSIGLCPEDSAALNERKGVQVEQFAELLASGNIMKSLQLACAGRHSVNRWRRQSESADSSHLHSRTNLPLFRRHLEEIDYGCHVSAAFH